jgi:hypothetical protein
MSRIKRVDEDAEDTNVIEYRVPQLVIQSEEYMSRLEIARKTREPSIQEPLSSLRQSEFKPLRVRPGSLRISTIGKPNSGKTTLDRHLVS